MSATDERPQAGDPGRPQEGGRLARSAATALVAGATVAAALLIAAACTPQERLQPLGALVRRTADVTPERVLRFRQVTAGLGVACILLGVWGACSRQGIGQFLHAAAEELRALRTAPRAWDKTPGWLWIVAVLILAGAGMRLMYLNGPMDYDEAYTFLNFARRPWYEAIADYNSTNNHPLNTFLMHWAYRLGGQTDWVLRLPVLLAGVALIPLAGVWASGRCGPHAALLCMALVASSPMLIDYSVNARGYMFLAAAAILLETCLERVDADRPYRILAWCGAWLAMVLGLWAMPIMVYPLAGCLGWFVLSPLPDRNRFRERISAVLVFAALGLLTVASLYAPAYVFRGLVAFQNPFVHPLAFSDWIRESPAAWRSAFERWCAGLLPLPCCCALLIAGLAALARRPALAWRIGCMFGATLVLMALHRVAPPTRLFLFLAPWFYLVVALGIEFLIGKLPHAGRWDVWVSLVVTVAGIVYAAAKYPVIGEPSFRDSLVSVRDAVGRIQLEAEASRGKGAVLMAPLPCDVPALYYFAQRGMSVPINRSPLPDEVIWLIALPGQPPDTTLDHPIVQLSRWKPLLEPWRRVQDFSSLTLWISDRRSRPANSPKAGGTLQSTP